MLIFTHFGFRMDSSGADLIIKELQTFLFVYIKNICVVKNDIIILQLRKELPKV